MSHEVNDSNVQCLHLKHILWGLLVTKVRDHTGHMHQEQWGPIFGPWHQELRKKGEEIISRMGNIL